MKLVCLLMVLLLLSPSAQALTLPPDISPGSAHFYSKTKIKSAANRAKDNCTSISDYMYKGTIFALELYLPALIGAKVIGKDVIKEVLGAGLKRAGMTSPGVSLSKKLVAPAIKKVSPLKSLKDFFSTNRHLAFFILGTIRKRPTPGGLRLASRTAIEMTVESYYYVASRNPGSPHLIPAERHLQNAIGEYGSYTGLLDAFTLTYSKFSPEGYNRILSECLLAIDELNSAKRQERDSKIRIA